MLRLDTRSSLLSLFTLPLVALVLASTLMAGVLSYRSATRVTDEIAQRWLASSVRSLGQILDSQQARVDASLRAAAPDASPFLNDLADDIEGLRQHLWSAALLHPQERAQLRLITAKGQAAAVQRLSAQDAELQLQLSPTEGPSSLVFRSADGALQARTMPSAPLSAGPTDPRDESWVRESMAETQSQWLATHTDETGTQLQARRVRPVAGAQGQTRAVVSTLVSWSSLQEALRRVPLPPGSEAVIVERDGLLVASSAGHLWRRSPEGGQQRLSVSDGSLPLIAGLYPRLLPQLGRYGADAPGSAALQVDGASATVASWARFADGAGRDWVLVVATPRSSLTAPLMLTMAHTVALSLLAAALVFLLSAWAQRRLLRDASELTASLQRISDGDVETPPRDMLSVELRGLRDTLRRAQLRMRTDRNSGLANRETVLNRLHERMRAGRRQNDAPLMALLFVDLDRFAGINERHGHEAGDFVLQAIGRHLRQTVRDTDVVARWSGDKFVVLLDGVDSAESAQRVRDQVERVLRDPVELGPGRDAAELDGTVGLALSRHSLVSPTSAVEAQPDSDEAQLLDADALLHAAMADMVRRKPSARHRP